MPAEIQGENNMDTEYASKGVAGSGLGLGIAGTALGLLNGGLGLMGNTTKSNTVTQEQMTDAQTISKLQSDLALSDAKYTNEVNENTKLTDVYKALATRDREIEGRLVQNEERLAADRAAFAEYRGGQAEIQRLRDENMRLYVDNKICPVNAKADTALGYINKIAAIGVASTNVYTAPSSAISA